MSKFVLSTMTNSVNYRIYANVGDLPTPVDSIIIHGGAGIPSMKSGFGEMAKDSEGMPIWTAEGMVTTLTDERYSVLKDHWLFKKHIDSGHIKVVDHDIRGNHKAIVRETKSMQARDGFAQLTKETLKQSIKVKANSEMEADAQFRL